MLNLIFITITTYIQLLTFLSLIKFIILLRQAYIVFNLFKDNDIGTKIVFIYLFTAFKALRLKLLVYYTCIYSLLGKLNHNKKI